MAYNVDLTDVLTTEKPTITINGKTYEVNDEKRTMLQLAKLEKDKKISDFDRIDKIMELFLGKEAKKEIDAIGFGIGQYATIANGIMASIQGVSLKEIEEQRKRTPR